MSPSSLEKLTVLLFVLSGVIFLTAGFYAVKFNVISSFIFELEQKKAGKKKNEPDHIKKNSCISSFSSEIDTEHKKITGTINVKRQTADISLADSIPSEKSHNNKIIYGSPLSENKVESVKQHNNTVAVSHQRIHSTDEAFSITENITVIPCSKEEITCIDES